ncbi:MAG: N-acetyl sugar amidotransferase [Candidatus Harrisonbacteria bacterium CG10_big_fil_rev_8_21_14_0_10_42_17]|uniref:N-acetyl sugar amidotransferase n=1 Tax=Candidatus Harrisonbacteria bacterium CG10_big_fil_rev_8_21_14_0_10_42_17 TaxID=1974584 RepID=A0A2M6WID2_9BACT|nr:MAG: N-acetyl sugar amidotransferase [Candidatus Harrisonbacteria bacterium CG10_big_fil_rev_8_21_14_0_10_42_17]
MRFCKRCTQPDTRPEITFDSDGVCQPCSFAEEHEKVDWTARHKELEKTAEFGRKNSTSGYDCIIPVSGGKDSMRQSMYVRDELGLNPLLVCCGYPPEQLTERGACNISNLITLGFDCIVVNPDPQVWKKMMRVGFLQHGNWAKSTEMALYASIPKVAIAYHIPLIYYGENPAIARGAMGVRSVTSDASGIKHSNTLRGGPESVKTPDITEQDLYWYRYPTDDEMEWAQLRIVYLGYYIKDFSRFKNGEFSIALGLEPRKDPPEDTGDYLGCEALDDDFVIVNQMLKYFKYGIGKTTDQTSEAIRLRLMTRDEGIELVRKYDGKCADHFIEKFCNYLEISKKEFWEVADRFRNPDIWEKNKQGNWKIKENILRI